MAFRVVNSICKREGWTIESLAYTKTSDSKVSGASGVSGTPKAGKTSSTSALASQTPITITGGAESHPPRVRDFEFTQNRGTLGGGSKYKSNGVTLIGSPERKTSVSRRRYRYCSGSPALTEVLAMGPAPSLSAGPSLLHTHDKATHLPSTSPKEYHQSVPSPNLQDKSASKDLKYRRRAPLKTSKRVESITSQEDWHDDSLGSDSDQDFKLEHAFHGLSGEVKVKRSTRVTAPHKLVDWSSESDDGATPDLLWKGNRRGRVSSPTPCPSGGEVKRPGRPRTYGSSKSLETVNVHYKFNSSLSYECEYGRYTSSRSSSTYVPSQVGFLRLDSLLYPTT